jgi:hypothetical protein
MTNIWDHEELGEEEQEEEDLTFLDEDLPPTEEQDEGLPDMEDATTYEVEAKSDGKKVDEDRKRMHPPSTSGKAISRKVCDIPSKPFANVCHVMVSPEDADLKHGMWVRVPSKPFVYKCEAAKFMSDFKDARVAVNSIVRRNLDITSGSLVEWEPVSCRTDSHSQLDLTVVVESSWLKSSAVMRSPLSLSPVLITDRLHHHYDNQPIVHGQQLGIILDTNSPYMVWCTCLLPAGDKTPAALLSRQTRIRVDSLKFQNLTVSF